MKEDQPIFPEPQFSIGQRVKTVETLVGTPRQGWVRQIIWHHKYQRYGFWIEREGVEVPRCRVSRRYWADDLEKL